MELLFAEWIILIELFVVHGILRDFFLEIIFLFVRKAWARHAGDERRDLLGFFISESSRRKIGHGVSDDSSKRIRARCTGAVVPGALSPQGSRFLVADLHSLTILAVARDALIKEKFL